MATRTVIKLVDDLDGSENAETVTFALQTTAYEIELTPEHRDELFRALAPYIENARKIKRPFTRKTA